MALGKERLMGLYRDMYLIRNFEDVIKEYAANGVIPGFVHLSTGQEACQSGVVRALRTTDYKYPITAGTELSCFAVPTPNTLWLRFSVRQRA